VTECQYLFTLLCPFSASKEGKLCKPRHVLMTKYTGNINNNFNDDNNNSKQKHVLHSDMIATTWL